MTADYVRVAPLIVVVEDEAIVLAGYQMLFESWGYRVIAAISADDALRQLDESEGRPGLILADLRLRDGCTGTDAIARVRAVCGIDVPGVLVTGDTAGERLNQAAALGLPILHKPVNGRHLQDLLQRTVGPA
ncbi:response regulator [Magnetospirillum sp. UT-4]|uniref:response regulator n=1 Tax=Magnetospirillum sp. UT-4 TaxID=2681467 RepID=UPI001573E307|nr:response regulator [Magnetospirillum sp. UT-4]